MREKIFSFRDHYLFFLAILCCCLFCTFARIAFAAELEVLARGRIVYVDQNDNVVPIKGAKVILLDDDFPVATIIGAAYSGDDGTFIVGGFADDWDIGCVEGVTCTQVGDQICVGAYYGNCNGGTSYGNNKCCFGIYEPHACNLFDWYDETDGKCHTLLGDTYDPYPRCNGCSVTIGDCGGDLPCLPGYWIDADFPDPYIQVEAVSEVGEIRLELVDYFPSPFPYCFRTDIHPVSSSNSELSFGDLMPNNGSACWGDANTSTENPAWHLHNSLYEAYHYMDGILNPSLDRSPLKNVIVLWPSDGAELGNASYADPFTGILHMHPDDGWEEETLYHEFAHKIFRAYSDSPVPYYLNDICDPDPIPQFPDLPFSGHCAWRPEDGCLFGDRGTCENTAHFTEGWPNFFSRVVKDDSETLADRDYEYPLTSHDTCAWGSSQQCPAADDNPRFAEGISTAILWDIYDDISWSPMVSATTEMLNDVWGSSETDVFAVGTNGTILHHHAQGWSQMTSSTSNILSGIWGSSGIHSVKDVFAVGSFGTILHYDGQTWMNMTSPTTSFLRDIWGSYRADVFAVGSAGIILHYDGEAWTEMSSGTLESLNDVWGSFGGDVFAVGSFGTIRHYDGQSWSSMSSPVNFTLNSIWGSSGSDVFAVGAAGTILHYDGLSWSSMNSPTILILDCVWGSSGMDVFASAYDTINDEIHIFHYDGQSWSEMEVTWNAYNLANPLYSMWGSSGRNVFAVGSMGSILHYGNDNHDSDNSADRLNASFKDIWELIRSYDPDPNDPCQIPVIGFDYDTGDWVDYCIDHPVTIDQFYDGFTARFPGMRNRIAEIYAENHLDKGVGADLSISSFTTSLIGSPPTVFTGEGFSVADTTENIGQTSLGTEIDSTTAYFLHSSDTLAWNEIESGSAIQIGKRTVTPLDPESSSTLTTNIMIPYSIAAGTYFLHACSDTTSVIFETDEDNNCLVGPQVTIEYGDFDLDGTTDDLDFDDDGDGVIDSRDCDPYDNRVFPGAQRLEVCDGLDNDCPPNGLIDDGLDADGDTISDCVDNCPDDPNPDQRDTDGDGTGDVCENRPPVADAGIDQTLECEDSSGTSVVLDGSASHDPDSDSLTFTWTGPFPEGSGTVHGINPSVTLPFGSWTISLIVNDGRVDSAADTMNVTIQDTVPPTLSVPPEKVDECAGPAGQTVDIGMATAEDACSEDTTITNNAPALYYLGTVFVTWTADDGNNNIAQGEQAVRIVDTTPPQITCPASVSVECESASQSFISLLPATATDICSGTVLISNDRTPNGADASGSYPLGQTVVTFIATDGSNNSSSCQTLITVVDTTPPAISASANPDYLWPPNHKMADVNMTVTVSDACDTDPGPTVILLSAISNEPDDAPGNADGHTTGDIQDATLGTPDYQVKLRAERKGSGSGRIYTLTYKATDHSGNFATSFDEVVIPHSLGDVVEPLDLKVHGKEATVISWGIVQGALHYDVIRGRLSNLTINGSNIFLGPVECIESDSSDTTTEGYEDTEIPEPDEAFFYLVQFYDGIKNSSYGTESAGRARVIENINGNCP